MNLKLGGAFHIWSGKEFIGKKMLRGNSIINASSAVFLKSAIPQDDSYTHFRYCGDWLFWSMIASRGNVVCINEYYNYFRMHRVKVTPKAMADGLSYIEGRQIFSTLANLAELSCFRRTSIEALRYCDMLMDVYIPEADKSTVGRKMQVGFVIKVLGRVIYVLKNIIKR